MVVLAGALFLQKTNLFAPAVSPTSTPNPPLLANDTNDKLTTIKLEDQHGLSITAKLGSDSQWTFETPAGLKVSQGTMQEILSALDGMVVQSALNSPLPLESTGLQVPTYTINLTYQSGQSHVIKVGNLTPLKNGYYIQVDTRDAVIVNQSGIDNIVELLKSVTYTPTPQESPTTSVTPTVTITPTP